MQKLLYLLMIIGIMSSCTDPIKDNGNSGLEGQWKHSKDSVVTKTKISQKSILGDKDTTQFDTTVNTDTTQNKLFERTSDSIFIYEKGVNETVRKAYSNDLIIGEGILKDFDTTTIRNTIDSAISVLKDSLQSQGIDVTVHDYTINYSVPKNYISDNNAIIEITASTTITAVATNNGLKVNYTVDVSATTYSIFIPYIGIIPPKDWPQPISYQ